MTPDAKTIATMRQKLLRFYLATRRDLPWRRTRDPYAIWVSEIMLQQTQVDTVKPRYEAFLAQFPTVALLAAATEHAVCEAWAGLGYYRRARHLHAAAQQVVAEHGGALPADVDALQKLKGVGRYTAGAIASIAFGLPAPLVDGNVVRVLSRWFAITDTFESTPGRKAFWALAEAFAVGESPGDLNQALMELGAMVCTPQNPRCDACPVSAHCAAFANGAQSQFPVAGPKIERRKFTVAFAWLPTPQGVWLERRGLEGLWAGLWELPSASGPGAKQALGERLGVTLAKPLARVTHELTHRQVTATIYGVRGTPRWDETEARQVYGDPLQAPLSALARKAIQACRTDASRLSV